MHITARADQALRSLLEIARAQPQAVKAETIATTQDIAPKILENVLVTLRRAGLVISRRGPAGGYWLARPAAEISLAQVIRAVEGPLASVRGRRPEDVHYPGAAQPLRQVWIALRVNIRQVLENVSLADITGEQLPDFVAELTADPTAWQRRSPTQPVSVTEGAPC